MDDQYGAGAAIYGTLITSLLALMIAVPLGVGTAIFITENIIPKRIRDVIGLMVELLAAIPSVVLGLWAIGTANGNSWHTMEEQVVRRSSADVWVLQETKLLEVQKLAAASNAARAQGWNPTLTYAYQTCAGKASGGAGVFAKKGMGAKGNTDQLVRDGMRHRISLTWLDGVLRGGVHCASIWLLIRRGYPRRT